MTTEGSEELMSALARLSAGIEAFREVVYACYAAPVVIYRNEDLATALAFMAVMPVVVPVAALIYFSIDREKRALLDETLHRSANL